VPKKEYQILGFHGGINDNSDPKDIQENELREADGVSVHRLGRITPIGTQGGTFSTEVQNLSSSTLEPGYGLHYFSTDYDASGNKESEDWLALYNKTTDKIRFYYKDKVGGTDGFLGSSNEISLGGDAKPNFYYVNGQLRVADSDFVRDSKYHGYIDLSLYWTSSGGNSNNIHDISKWVNNNQKLKSIVTLIGDGLRIIDLSSVGPNFTKIGDGNTKKLLLGYWSNEGGEWSGSYEFGVTPIYKGNQEGPISTIEKSVGVVDVIHLYGEQLMFQVFIPSGTSASLNANTVHRLGDDRIIGLNWYFREQGEKDWFFLMNTDLKEGGKHYWKVYNTSTSDNHVSSEKNHGYWTGAVVNHTGGSVAVPEGVDILKISTNTTAISFYDTVSSSGSASGINWMVTGNTYDANTKGKAYENVYLRVMLNNSNILGFENRNAFLKIWGGHVSPLYANVATGSDGTSKVIPLKTGQAATAGTDWDTYYVPLVLPSIGTDREFRVQVLDENFSIVADSGIKTMTIENPDATGAPDDYEQEVE